MKSFRLFLLLSVAAAGAWAQLAPSRRSAPAPLTTRELRRAELRSAFKALQEQEQSATAEAEALVPHRPYDLHLSAQERADLRQQLRQQRLDALDGTATKPD